MTRRIDYAHADILSAIEKVKKAEIALKNFHGAGFSDLVFQGADEDVFEARRLLKATRLKLESSEQVITNWKTENGEIE